MANMSHMFRYLANNMLVHKVAGISVVVAIAVGLEPRNWHIWYSMPSCIAGASDNRCKQKSARTDIDIG